MDGHVLGESLATGIHCLQWHGGDALCRLVAFVRLFAFCITSNLVAVIAVDRAIVARQLTSAGVCRSRRRMRALLAAAYALAVACSLGQLGVWRTFDVASDEQTGEVLAQCVTCWTVNGAMVLMNNDTALSEALDVEAAYTYAVQAVQFWLPAGVVVAAYALSVMAMRRQIRYVL